MKAKSSTPAAPVQARSGRHLNALKHGLNSGSVLLPGDNVAAFRTLRQREFRLHRPRTIEEARYVETIVASHWRIERCRVEQKIFKQHLGAVLSGDRDVTGYLADADPHRLHHRGTDCGLEERRLEKSKAEATAALALVQKLRVQQVLGGDPADLEDYTVFMAEGDPVVDEETPMDPSKANDSADGGKLGFPKTRFDIPEKRFPAHWSQRQREAAMQREGG